MQVDRNVLSRIFITYIFSCSLSVSFAADSDLLSVCFHEGYIYNIDATSCQHKEHEANGSRYVHRCEKDKESKRMKWVLFSNTVCANSHSPDSNRTGALDAPYPVCVSPKGWADTEGSTSCQHKGGDSSDRRFPHKCMYINNEMRLRHISNQACTSN
jgi:hypothetical protein